MAHVLRRLPAMAHPDLIVGAEHFSDAGVFRLRDDLALVQTTDFFPPLVDDPREFGRIAAANALSDCYAMGGRPITALNLVGFPDRELPDDLLVEILAGGADKVLEAGAVIVGGHSVRDAEIKYGLAVTGVVDPRRLITNAAARPGDALVLTKPIGSGILTTAAKKGLIAEADLAECIDVMTRLNREASERMTAPGPEGHAPAHAATDITGFGLLGHLFEMAEASGATIRLFAGRVPLMRDALRLAEQGCVTRAHKSTLEHLGAELSADGVPPALLHALADAQTSGGLVISMAAESADAFAAALHPAGAVIGRVEPRGKYALFVSG